jgi:hypothetical protein
MLSRLMKSKTSYVLFKFLQSTNIKGNNININYNISDKFNFLKIITILIKIVTIIFYIIINMIILILYLC